ncbi:hypothetical protein BJF84_03565 [Rhodococcus sp. CUA-806]|nr:hypothetical protein BJF84_03565 [Rhodococcus sp. CUA-806]
MVRSDAGLPREIENTLEGVWPAITALAKRLYVDGKVGHDAVLAALGMNGDGQHDNSVRASIRFGDWSPDATWSMPGSGNWRDAERAG